MITISAFKWVPDFARGQVRDLRVRWALEEAGLRTGRACSSTAGDLMMTTVLRILKHTDIVTRDKRLAAYIDRCTARPAFARAFDAQIGDFRDAA